MKNQDLDIFFMQNNTQNMNIDIVFIILCNECEYALEITKEFWHKLNDF